MPGIAQLLLTLTRTVCAAGGRFGGRIASSMRLYKESLANK
jgi:hypothetical protein